MAGLLNYPVLQAADILLYRADIVPVGEDQVQHLELSREVARRWNARYSPDVPYFPEPKPRLTPTRRILGLDGSAKMSKSMGNTIGLLESPEDIWEKLRPAVTDPARKRRTDPGNPDICNIYTLHRAFSPEPLQVEAADEVPERGVGLHRLQEGAARADARGVGADQAAREGIQGRPRYRASRAGAGDEARAHNRRRHDVGRQGQDGAGVSEARKLAVDLRAQAHVWRVPEYIEQLLLSSAPPGWTVSIVRTDTISDGDGGHTPTPAALAAISDAEVYFGYGITRPLFLAAKKLRWAHSAAAGVGGALYDEMRASDVILTNSAGVHAIPMAEYVIGGSAPLLARLRHHVGVAARGALGAGGVPGVGLSRTRGRREHGGDRGHRRHRW